MEDHLQLFFHLTLNSSEEKDWGKQFFLLRFFHWGKRKVFMAQNHSKDRKSSHSTEANRAFLELSLPKLLSYSRSKEKQNGKCWTLPRIWKTACLQRAHSNLPLPSHHVCLQHPAASCFQIQIPHTAKTLQAEWAHGKAGISGNCCYLASKEWRNVK